MAPAKVAKKAAKEPAGTSGAAGAASSTRGPGTGTPAFEVKDITKVYRMGETEVHALRGVTAAIPEGEFAVLLGPSGSGKSTFLNILGGLDRPTSGTVHFQGRELTGLGDRDLTLFRRENVGFIFQFYNLMPALTARENVALVTEIADDPMDPMEALRLVSLGERADHFPSQMSGGEQQRVAIARAIAKRPHVLLCDEPTGALDRETGMLVLEALVRANEELGTTTLIITHNAATAGLGDRVMHFADGVVSATDINERRKAPRDIEW